MHVVQINILQLCIIYGCTDVSMHMDDPIFAISFSHSGISVNVLFEVAQSLASHILNSTVTSYTCIPNNINRIIIIQIFIIDSYG